MDTTRAQPTRRASRELLPLLGMLCVFGAIGLILVVQTSQGLPWPQDQSGHLPWPVVQWALTTPPGALVSMAVGTATLALISLPGLVSWIRIAFRDRLAHAVDMTDVPREAWPMHPLQQHAETRTERWLGHGRHAQQINLALLILALLLALTLLTGLIAAFAYSSTALYRVAYIHICELHGCPPIYPALSLMGVSIFLVNPFIWFFGLGWLPYVEARCGIRLSYPSVGPVQMMYVRQPGVTREAAAAALARFVPRNGAPRARVIAVIVLAMAPLALLLSAAVFLNSWLQLQWIPG